MIQSQAVAGIVISSRPDSASVAEFDGQTTVAHIFGARESAVHLDRHVASTSWSLTDASTTLGGSNRPEVRNLPVSDVLVNAKQETSKQAASTQDRFFRPFAQDSHERPMLIVLDGPVLSSATTSPT